MADQYQVVVRLRSGDAVLESPRYGSEDEAKSDLAAISQAQQEGEWINLPWLSLNGGEVLVAQIVEQDLPSVG